MNFIKFYTQGVRLLHTENDCRNAALTYVKLDARSINLGIFLRVSI